MASQRAALLIGGITHSRKEWEALSRIARLLEYPSGSREDFLSRCKKGDYNSVIGIYRSNDSTKVTGPFDADLVSQLPKSVKYIAHNGAGYDNIDVAACTKRGISVSNTPIAVNAATADTGIFLMLGALRRFQAPALSVHKGEWRGPRYELGHDPEGKVLGILGMGGIGTDFASKARGFGMKIQYHNRRRLPESEEKPLEAKYVPFDELLSTSDVLSLNLGLNERTKHIIDKAEFDKMKPGIVIVNTARGPIINEAALVQALKEGKVWGVGLDVFEDEPKIHPGLIDNEKAFILPHMGTSTFETQRAMELLVLENLRMGIEEGKMKTLVPEQQQKD
jgi:glyoxylate reductase